MLWIMEETTQQFWTSECVFTPLDWVLVNFSSWCQTTFVKLSKLVLQSEWDIDTPNWALYNFKKNCVLFARKLLTVADMGMA